MKFREGFERWLLLSASLILLGCPGSTSVGSGSDKGGSDMTSDAQVCTPGESADCFTCEGDVSEGSQTCTEDGSGWGECECQGVPEPDAGTTQDIVLIAPDEGQGPSQVLTVPLRVHVVKSSTVPELNADSAGLGPHLEPMNEIWAPAGIQFEVESTIEYEALRQDDFAELLETGTQENQELAGSMFRCQPGDCFFDTDQALMNGDRPGYNVVVVASMGQLPVGFYMDTSGFVIHSQDKSPRLLARNLGRAMRLNRSGCGDPCNLMRSGQCGQVPQANNIDSCQAEGAREQAESGSPAPPQVTLKCPCNGLILPGSDECQGHQSSCESEGPTPLPEPGPGPQPGQNQCEVDDDCAAEGKCSLDTGLGCSCIQTPSGMKRCLALCDSEHECPEIPNPNITLQCVEGICRPQGAGPGGGS